MENGPAEMISVLLQSGKVWPFRLAVIPFHSQSETRPYVKWRMLNICHSVGFSLKHLFISLPCIFFTFQRRGSSPFDPHWRRCGGEKMVLSGAHIIAESLVEDRNVFDNGWWVSGTKMCDGDYMSPDHRATLIKKITNKKEKKKGKAMKVENNVSGILRKESCWSKSPK